MVQKNSIQGQLNLISHSTEQTLAFGRRIGACLKPNDIVALVGQLGAGKTWLSKGISFGLGVPEHEYVNSPAFDLIHEYRGDLPVYHIDFYRLDALSGEDYLWLEEYLFSGGVCIIEWANKFIDQLVSEYLRIELSYVATKNHRRIGVTPIGERYKYIIEKLERQ
jgi:tRNA threonylcarbamoyladenosine biosynthesis protein TsaE